MPRELELSSLDPTPEPQPATEAELALALRDLILMYCIWFFLSGIGEMTKQLVLEGSLFLTQAVHYLFFITARLLFIPAALYFIIYRRFFDTQRVGLTFRNFWRMSKVGLKISLPLIPLTLFLVHLPLVNYGGLRPLYTATTPGAMAVSLVYSFSLFFMTLIPAFSEELLFRGLTFTFLQERLGTPLALLLNGIIYGIFYMRFNIYLVVIRIILGFLTTYLFWRSKSLIPSTFVQAAFHTAFIVYIYGWSWW